METDFNKWRNRVKKSIKPLLVEFFSKDVIRYEQGKQVGFIIESLYNPYYDILDSRLEHLDSQNIICKQILLEIAVESFYKSVLVK